MGKLFLMILISGFLNHTVRAQQPGKFPRGVPDPGRSKDSLPYRVNPILPEFSIMLMDSSTIFNSKSIPTGKPIVLMLFSPGCQHCSDAIDTILKGMDMLNDVRFYLISTMQSMTMIRKFYNDHHLERYKNIEAIGWDFDFFYLEDYGTMQIPDFAVYTKNKKLIKLFEVNMSARELYDCTR